MTELIKIESKNGIETVSARELWEKLESKRQFGDWIKDKLLDFSKNEDYITFSQNCEKPSGGRPSIEYYLTIDTAKHICMLERNEKGKQIRQYFIDFEKKHTALLPKSPIEVIQAGYIALQKMVDDMKPKADFFDAVAGSKDAIEMKEVAKVLDMGIGRNKLFEFLRNAGVLMQDNTPYQKHIDAGRFRLIEQSYQTEDGETHISLKTLVYQSGIDYIRKLIINSEINQKKLDLTAN